MGGNDTDEKYRRAMQSLRDKAKSRALKIQKNTQLSLETLFKDVVSKHKQLTQNQPQIPVPVINQLPKKHKMEQNKQQHVPMHRQSVMEQIIQVISHAAPALLQNQVPSTSAAAPAAAIMAPGQSVMQQPNPVAALTGQKAEAIALAKKKKRK